jgi:hypothetical protein
MAGRAFRMGHSFHYVGYALIAVKTLLWSCAVIILYLSFTIWAARRAVKRLDREHYFLCDKHGAISESDMLSIAEFDDGGLPPPPMCPLCFTDRMADAESRLKAVQSKSSAD